MCPPNMARKAGKPAASSRNRRAPRRRSRTPPLPQQDLPAPLRHLRRTHALAASLTHASVAGPGTARLRHWRQRLELLGDAVWNLAVLQHLFRDAAAPRADLARRKAHLAGGPFMAEVARQIGLQRALRTGPGPAAAALKDRPSVLASTLEAILGAWYLQAGLAPILRFVHRVLAVAARPEGATQWLDPKSELQQVVTRRFRTLPSYRILERSGTAHAPAFLVEVTVEGTALGVGRGSSRRAAEQVAARAALDRLEELKHPAESHKM